MPPDTDRLIFVHIPKSGGTTLGRALCEKFGRSEVAHIRKSDALTQPTPCDTSASLVMGHVSYGLHERFAGTSAYITMLREPTARSISQYHAWLRRRSLSARSHSIDKFLASTRKLNNDQTRIVLGGSASHRPLSLSDLDQAKEHLETRFLFAGVTERFDESIVLLARKLSWNRPPCYIPSNRTARPLAQKDLSPSVMCMIRERNELDFALHKHAKRLMEKEVQAIGKELVSQQVQAYQKRNRLYFLNAHTRRIIRYLVPASLQNSIYSFSRQYSPK